MNLVGKKGEKLRSERCSHAVGSSRRTQRRDGRKSAIAGICFSWEEQRNLVGIPAWVGSMSIGWTQKPGQGHSSCDCSCQVICIPEKQSHRAWPNPNFPEVTFLHPWYQVMEHFMCKPENYYYRITFFFLNKGCVLWLVLGSGHRGSLAKIWLKSQLPREENKEADHPTALPCITATLKAASGCGGQHQDFMDLKPHCPTNYTGELVPWDCGDQSTNQGTSSLGYLKSQISARELKIFD